MAPKGANLCFALGNNLEEAGLGVFRHSFGIIAPFFNFQFKAKYGDRNERVREKFNNLKFRIEIL